MSFFGDRPCGHCDSDRCRGCVFDALGDFQCANEDCELNFAGRCKYDFEGECYAAIMPKEDEEEW